MKMVCPPHKLDSKLPKETTPKFLSPLLERFLLFPFPCVFDGNQDYRVVPLTQTRTYTFRAKIVPRGTFFFVDGTSLDHFRISRALRVALREADRMSYRNPNFVQKSSG